MKVALITFLAAGLAAGAISTGPALAAEWGALRPNTVAACERCHGPGGNSTSRSVPRLNGQQPAYIWARLKAFLDPTSQTPGATHAMWETASHIRPEEINAIGSYFGSQAPSTAGNAGKAAAVGRNIYRMGAGRSVPACRRCHGAQGEGSGAIPRLAGQHAEYLSSQLMAFNLRTRYHDRMNDTTVAMKPDQVRAIVEYLAND